MSKQRYKVICIKDAEYDSGILFKAGETYVYYVTIYRGENAIEVRFLPETENKFDRKVVGFYVDKPIDSWRKFSDYFVPLAEWRERQINSILEDD